ncbi:MAG: hypothetical protein DRP11_00950 [Candidatus Aenigmatarchaeota archaeon]|nr:MAG: hypothetical protein DRP11_00950 [Candidatus Aenigmarchaeota archaeon]
MSEQGVGGEEMTTVREIAEHDARKLAEKYNAQVVYDINELPLCCSDAFVCAYIRKERDGELFWGSWTLYRCPRCGQRYIMYQVTDSPSRTV